MLPPYLTKGDLQALLQRALDEDLGEDLGAAARAGDVTTEATVPRGAHATAHVQAKEGGTVAGLAVAERVFATVDDGVAVRWHTDDGTQVDAGEAVGQIEGAARSLLIGERLALNFMQRMSGIATATRRMVDRAAPHGAEVLDTRKTAPGLRALDKWAVHLGGGTNHRLGLHDLILIKDNHIAASGGVAAALQAAHRYREEQPGAGNLRIELETRTLDEVHTALAADERGYGPEVVLLDNMARRTAGDQAGPQTNVEMLREAVELVGGRFVTEASGNVTLQTVEAIAQTGVDHISSGALTHSVRALDLSMEVVLEDGA